MQVGQCPVLASARSVLNEPMGVRLLELVERTPFQHGGLLPSEMHLFLTLCLSQSVDYVIESGRDCGYSTELIWRAGFDFVSYDDRHQEASVQRLVELGIPTQSLKQGDGRDLVPQTVSKLRSSHRLAVLLDGPKGAAAFNILSQIENDCAFVAIHDVHQFRSDGEVNPTWRLACDWGMFVSERATWLDSLYACDEKFAKFSEHESRDSLVAYGFGLGVWRGGRWQE